MNFKKIYELLKFDTEDNAFELLEKEGSANSSSNKTVKVQSAGTNTAHGLSVPLSIDAVTAELSGRFYSDINKDLIMRKLILYDGSPILIVYINGMADASEINDFIVRPIVNSTQNRVKTNARVFSANSKDAAHANKKLCELRDIIQIAESIMESDFEKAVDSVLDGMTAVFAENESSCILLETRGFEKRSIGTAENETVVLGPKESFTESLRTNLTLIRRIVHLNELVAEMLPSGGKNNTKTALVYIKGFANESLISELKSRLCAVKLNGLTCSGMIEQTIEDRHFLPLPQTLSTERPDRAASHIMQGCVCLLSDGSPFGIVLPITLFSLMNSPEDVYLRKPLGSLLRVIRYAGALISILLPGYFLALAMYHQGGLSTEVLSTVISSRKMVFEPIAIEMILLLLVFQLIREAGLRVPGSIGQAIGIIGGLIMGQAAVAANLASSVVLIIVAVSGLGNFCIPDYSLQLSAAYFRMTMVIAAWLGGLLGMVCAAMIITALIAGQKSFGVPYLSPYAPKAVSMRGILLRGRLQNCPRPDDQNNTSFDNRIGFNEN